MYPDFSWSYSWLYPDTNENKQMKNFTLIFNLKLCFHFIIVICYRLQIRDFERPSLKVSSPSVWPDMTFVRASATLVAIALDYSSSWVTYVHSFNVTGDLFKNPEL